jgi:hypothetical protein
MTSGTYAAFLADRFGLSRDVTRTDRRDSCPQKDRIPALLADGIPREDVLAQLVTDPITVDTYDPLVLVLACQTGLLMRPVPDPLETAWYLDRLTGHLGPAVDAAAVLRAHLASAEFAGNLARSAADLVALPPDRGAGSAVVTMPAPDPDTPPPDKVGLLPDVTTRTARMRVWLGHDSTHFYLTALVRDTTRTLEREPKTMWKNDCLQIAVDCGRKEGDLDRCFEFGVSADPQATDSAARTWCWRAPAGCPTGPVRFPAAVRWAGGESVYEVAIPWSAIGNPPHGPGDSIGLGLVLNNAGEPGNRRDAYEWYSGIVREKDARQYGVVTFAELSSPMK